MDKKEVAQIANGLYVVKWKDGSQSWAAVGRLHDGTVWIAPTNWVAETPDFIGWISEWGKVAALYPVI